MKMAEKKNKVSPFWERVEELVSRPKRRMRGVNLGKIGKYTKAGQTVVVADKILSTGKIPHAVTVAAPALSAIAAKALKGAGCKIVSIDELKKSNPSGKDVVILA